VNPLPFFLLFAFTTLKSRVSATQYANEISIRKMVKLGELSQPTKNRELWGTKKAVNCGKNRVDPKRALIVSVQEKGEPDVFAPKLQE